MLSSRRSGAFTLLELIVVVVILGVLAAIAVPTFARVIERSGDEAALVSLRALAREAQALEAFDRNGWDGSEVVAAGADLAAAPGLYAAASPVARDAGVDPGEGEYTYAVSGEGVVVATATDSGQVCLVGLNYTAVADGTCSEPAASGSSIGAALSTLAAASEVLPAGTATVLGVTTSPTGATPAPTVPAPQPIGWTWRTAHDGYHFGKPSGDQYWGWAKLQPGTVVTVKDYAEPSGPYAGQVHDVEVIIMDHTNFNSNWCTVISPKAAAMGWSSCSTATPGLTSSPTISASDPSRVVVPDNGHDYYAHVVDYGPLDGVSDYSWCTSTTCDPASFSPLPASPDTVLFDRQIATSDGAW